MELIKKGKYVENRSAIEVQIQLFWSPPLWLYKAAFPLCGMLLKWGIFPRRHSIKRGCIVWRWWRKAVVHARFHKLASLANRH